MYQIIFDDEALRFLEHLPKILRDRIRDKIFSTKPNPHHYFKRLEARNDYSLRVGDHRVIADIDDNTRCVEITMIGHRKNVYD